MAPERIVLVHGWGHDGAAFESLQRELEPRIVCDAIDLPGHGRRWNDLLTFDLPALSAAVAEALPAPARGVLLGWSLGSLVVLSALAEDADLAGRVRGIVLVAGTSCFLTREGYPQGQEATVLERLRAWVTRDPARALARFSRWLETPSLPSRGEIPSSGCLLQTLDLLERTDLRHRLSEIDVPALVLHGEADSIVPVASSRYLADRLPAARLEILPAGHAPFASHTGECVERILEFLESLDTGGRS